MIYNLHIIEIFAIKYLPTLSSMLVMVVESPESHYIIRHRNKIHTKNNTT